MALKRVSDTWCQCDYIYIRNLGTMNGSRGYQRKTNIYEVYAAADNFLLGRIAWFGRWRKYVFEPAANTIYEERCMRDISQFIEEETKAQQAKPKPKVKACEHCDHPNHVKGDCDERLCDAAGDMDWCPCSYGTAKNKKKAAKA